jgi:hypothetical protein
LHSKNACIFASMSKVKVVAPSGKIVYLGEKAMQSSSVRGMGYRLYDEVYPPVPPVAPKVERTAPVVNPVADTVDEADEVNDEQPPRKQKRKRTKPMSDADQA